MAGKFHIKKDGNLGPCRASKACPLGEDTPHFNDRATAMKFIEDLAAKDNSTFNSFSSVNSVNDNQTSTVDEIVDESNVDPEFDDWYHIRHKLVSTNDYQYSGDDYVAYISRNDDGSYYTGVFRSLGREYDTGASIDHEDEENFATIDEAIEKLNKVHDMSVNPADYIDGPDYY